MFYRDLTFLPELVLAPGYKVQCWQVGDEIRWINVLQTNGELGEWNLDRVQKAFHAENGRVWPESIHLLVHNDEVIATACVQLHSDTPTIPELGWVATIPAGRGQGLGRAVSIAVMHFMRKSGFQSCFLRTQDWRLPAIKTYLRLGFVPDLSHESYPDRWQAIYHRLKEEGVDFPELKAQ
jgi:mycothiol synthase